MKGISGDHQDDPLRPTAGSEGMNKNKISLGEAAAESIDQSGPQGEEFIYIDISSIDRTLKRIGNTKTIRSDQAPNPARQRLRAGDVLVSMTRPNLNAVALVPEDLDGAIGSTGFHVLRSKWVDSKFLFYLVQTREFIDQMTLGVQGALFPAVRPRDVLAFAFPLPSASTQRGIVAKIEALFSELDQGVESLKTAREQLKVYRQAVLKQAFEGKLTDQWRRKNKDRLENPLKMLKRLRQEREACYRQQLSDWETAVRAWEVMNKDEKRPIKPKAPTPFQEPTPEELAELPDLPDGWIWVRPEDIAAQEEYAIGIGPFGSNLKVSDYRDNGIPLIFVRNITRSDFSRDLKYIDPEKYAELIAHSVKPLDLLITKMGDPPGDCEIYPETSPEAVLTADCLKFRLWEKYGNRKFYKNCINSSLVRRQLGLITKGVAQKKISTARFKTILIPFFSIDEQQIIADHLDDVFSIVDQQEQAISESLQKAEALRQSILKKAFSGQIVPQDPGDEPASVLLARIRIEKDARSKSNKRKSTRQPRSNRVTSA
jgi:type I restriction enzyme S subunit